MAGHHRFRALGEAGDGRIEVGRVHGVAIDALNHQVQRRHDAPQRRVAVQGAQHWLDPGQLVGQGLQFGQGQIQQSFAPEEIGARRTGDLLEMAGIALQPRHQPVGGGIGLGGRRTVDHHHQPVIAGKGLAHGVFRLAEGEVAGEQLAFVGIDPQAGAGIPAQTDRGQDGDQRHRLPVAPTPHDDRDDEIVDHDSVRRDPLTISTAYSARRHRK
jgi:hypothetical protein